MTDGPNLNKPFKDVALCEKSVRREKYALYPPTSEVSLLNNSSLSTKFVKLFCP